MLGGTAKLFRDDDINVVSAFVPDPNKSQVTSAMTGTITFKKGIGASVNVTGWLVICIVPSANVTYYFNTDTTKTMTLFSGRENYIFMSRDSISQVVVSFGAATANVQGM